MITLLIENECRTIGAQGVFIWKLRQGVGDTWQAAVQEAGEGWRVSGYETRGGRPMRCDGKTGAVGVKRTRTRHTEKGCLQCAAYGEWMGNIHATKLLKA